MRDSKIDIQISSLLKEGYSEEEIAESLGLDPRAVTLAVRSWDTKPLTLDELLETFKETELGHLLIEIARGSERDSDRLAAIKLILERSGNIPKQTPEEIQERFRLAGIRVIEAEEVKEREIPEHIQSQLNVHV